MALTPFRWVDRSACLVITLFIAGLTCIFATAPFQVPDEGAHLSRALQIGMGHLKGEVRNRKAGGELPSDFVETVNSFDIFRVRSPARLGWAEFKDQYKNDDSFCDPNYSSLAWAPFSNTVLYSPIPYLPQIVSTLIARRLCLGSLTLLYLARVITFSLSCTFLFLAFREIRWSVRNQNALFWLCALPITLSELASASADSLTISLSFFAIALILTLERDWKQQKFILLVTTLCGLSLCKSLYGLVGVFLAPTLVSRLYQGRKLELPLYIIAMIVPTFIWSRYVRDTYVPIWWVANVDPNAQLVYLIHQPFAVLTDILFFQLKSWHFYLETFVGMLGRFDVFLPQWIHYGYRGGLLLTPLLISRSEDARGSERTTINTIWSLLAFILLFLFVDIAIYLSAAPVGSRELDGFQIRYITPFAPAIFLGWPFRLRFGETASRYWNAFVVGAFALLFAFSVRTICVRYWS